MVTRTAAGRRARPAPTLTGRPGHSLPELIVAVMFLASSLVAVGASAVLGARWTAVAGARQDATRVAAAVLDSVAAIPAVSDGGRSIDGFRVRWTSGPEGVLVVRVFAGGRFLVELAGVRLPTVPVLPDAGSADSTAGPDVGVP